MLMAFIATVIGGMGSLAGAVIAGFLLGAIAVVMQVILPPDARAFRDAFVYGAVILVLIFRPQGLLTARGTEGAGVMAPRRKGRSPCAPSRRR